MWFLTIMPAWAIHTILLVGIIGLVLSFIPLIGSNNLVVRSVSLLLIVIGVYFEGGIANEREWKLKIADLEKKLAESQAKSEKINTEVVTKVITKKQVIKEAGEEVIRYIDREVVKYDESCPIPTEVVNAVNAAAQNKPVEEKK